MGRRLPARIGRRRFVRDDDPRHTCHLPEDPVSSLDRQHWEAQELAREAHDVEVMIDWEQELRQLGLLAKAGQSRSLTEHIIEDHAEFWCLCLAIPRVYISDSVDEWYDEDTHESE